MLLSLAALLCLISLTADTALAQGAKPSIVVSTSPAAGRSPEIVHQVQARVPSAVTQPDGTIQQMEFEGLNSTNYLSLPDYVVAPPNPEIAAGPTDVLVVVNRGIARLRNPNNPVVSNPAGDPTWLEARTNNNTDPDMNAQYTPFSHRAMLDAMVGSNVLNRVCPSRTSDSTRCVVDNGTIRYDQMHGRFLILFTVVDLSSGSNPVRKASWVLVVSRFPGLRLPQAMGDASPFSLAAGSPNSDNWLVWYGNNDTGGVASNNISGSPAPYGSDGFSGPYGNINAISTNAATVATNSGINAGVFDCRFSAIAENTSASQLATPSTFCYVPTGARLGYDNETVVITSPVINANIPDGTTVGANRRGLLTSSSYPAYGGTRIRVIKKAALYAGVGKIDSEYGTGNPTVSGTNRAMIMGNSYFTGALTNTITGADIYDLYTTTPQGSMNVYFGATDGGPNYVLDPNLPAWQGLVVSPYTLHSEAGAPPDTLFWEPAETRGRPMAFYSGFAIPGASDYTPRQPPFPTFIPARGATYLVGARSIPYAYSNNNPLDPLAPWSAVDNNQLFIQPIRYVTAAVVKSFAPILVGMGIYGNAAGTTGYKKVTVEAYADPAQAPQKGGTTLLNVGDARPQRVISREGHLYIARAVSNFNERQFYPDSVTGSPLLNNTVAYNIVQVHPRNPLLTALARTAELDALANAYWPHHVLAARWRNGIFFTPMFTIPANVFRYSAANPINLLPFLEKLFVGTTSNVGSFPGDPRFNTGGTLEGCSGVSFSGGLGSVAGNGLLYTSLYDMRCGKSYFVQAKPYNDAITGQYINTVPPTGTGFGTWGNNNRWSNYAGAAIDPIAGGAWIYGPYAGGPFQEIFGNGQWATYGAYYKMSFPATDDYGNAYMFTPDATPPGSASGAVNEAYFQAVEVLRRHGMSKWDGFSAPTGAQLIEPPLAFGTGADVGVRRKEMARVVVLSMMDQEDVLALTDPIKNSTVTESYFADVAKNNAYWPYIEILGRLGIVKGCGTTDVGILTFCPDRYFTRGEMAVVLVRSKLNNVFPTLINGCPSTTGCAGALGALGDNFGYFLAGNPNNANQAPHGQYFADVPTTSGWYPYVQMMMALRITTGTGPGVYTMGTSPCCDPNDPGTPAAAALTRVQLATFLTRCFYY